MAINGFIQNVSQDARYAGAFGALFTPIISATSEEDLGPISQTLVPMFFGNATGALASSFIGNAAFKAAVQLIKATNVKNETSQRAILTATAVIAFVTNLFLTVLVQNHLETRSGEAYADAFGFGMAMSMTAVIFLMKDRYNHALSDVSHLRHDSSSTHVSLPAQ